MIDHSQFNEGIRQKAQRIKLLFTDVDGVLTDNGVYYSANGEEMKRFSIRDGMGVERLRKLAGVDTGIITGENSPSVAQRAEKLRIVHLHLGVSDKLGRLADILQATGLTGEEIAYIGDDTNDLEIMKAVGLTAAPGDATSFAREQVDYICTATGGYGAFREFAELIIHAKNNS